jgi:hypothetical protein
MATPYSAGGVSIAQSNQHVVGPLLLAACGLSTISGPTFPRVPGAVLIVSDSNTHRI